MFIPSDTVTEIIAHFLGYFEIRVEELRLRLDYEEFVRDQALPPQDPHLLNIPVDAIQQFSFLAFDPGVVYYPPVWYLRGEAPVHDVHAAPAFWADPWLPWSPRLATHVEGFSGSDMPPILIGPQPDSVIAVMSQQITLMDHDIVILGEFEGTIDFQSGSFAALETLTGAAYAIGAPVTDISVVHAVSDVPLFMAKTVEYIDSLESTGSTAQMTVVDTDDIAGIYVNGEMAAQAPDILDFLPEQLLAELEGDDAAPGPAVNYAGETIYGSDVPESVALEAGANMLVNEAGVLNAGLTSVFLGVLGNFHQLDVIIQTNAYSDVDSLGAGIHNIGAPTSAFNIAEFKQQVMDGASQAQAENPDEFPAFWQVSVVKGDIIFVEWMQQFTFMSDEDIHVLSATGTTTTVTTGENIGLNGISFENLGQYYDLIIIGGNLYDANIIVQTNVLYDNDTLEVLAGGQGFGASTGGNLLWNQATILNVGANEVTAGSVPDHYQQAADRLSDDNYNMPDGFKHDASLEGFGALRVLYVTGDVYDLRYVEQTNVLGDADYVATQESKLLAENKEVTYEVSTGSNALINTATIIDYDTLGDTAHVGGEVYSDAILIQADMVAPDTGDGTGEAALVTEVVAFLDTDTIQTVDDDIGHHTVASDGPPADIMQSVLA
jgi:hypothetical protein